MFVDDGKSCSNSANMGKIEKLGGVPVFGFFVFFYTILGDWNHVTDTMCQFIADTASQHAGGGPLPPPAGNPK